MENGQELTLGEQALAQLAAECEAEELERLARFGKKIVEAEDAA